MPDDHYLAFKLLMSKIPEGKIEDQAVSSEIETALIKIWPLLAGASEEGMDAAKLRGRMESIEWTPPILTFVIERHGAQRRRGGARGSHRPVSNRSLGRGAHRHARPARRQSASARASQRVRLAVGGAVTSGAITAVRDTAPNDRLAQCEFTVPSDGRPMCKASLHREAASCRTAWHNFQQQRSNRRQDGGLRLSSCNFLQV